MGCTFFAIMKKIKLSELFSYENIINDKTAKARVLVWNNRTMLIAEENSALFCSRELTFDELLQGALMCDENAINDLLFSAMSNAVDNLSFNEFLDYFEPGEYDGYKSAVLDGIIHYLPEEELKTEAEEFSETDSPNDGEESGHWASLYYFSKKYLLMSDEEFLNSTWRKISILQCEFRKTLPSHLKKEVTPADEVNFL